MVRRGWQEAKETQAMLGRAVEALGEEFTARHLSRRLANDAGAGRERGVAIPLRHQ